MKIQVLSIEGDVFIGEVDNLTELIALLKNHELTPDDIWFSIPDADLWDELIKNWGEGDRCVNTNGYNYATSETWRVFDMSPEHVDPRLVYWLWTCGIVMTLNGLGRNPGVIAQAMSEIPDRIRENLYPPEQLDPPTISLTDTQAIGDLKALMAEYDAKHGKPSRVVRNPLAENYGRLPQQETVVNCLLEWLNEVEYTLARIKECDEKALGDRLSINLNFISSNIQWMRKDLQNIS